MTDLLDVFPMKDLVGERWEEGGELLTIAVIRQ